MRPQLRLLLTLSLAMVGLFACTQASEVATQPGVSFTPLFARIKATDSNMVETDISYGDTALVLKRWTAVPQDLVVSAEIGPDGGEMKIDEAGVRISIPKGALTAPTTITMRAVAGFDVAYEFEPHGLQFAQPVKITQRVAGTWADSYGSLLKTIRGSYYPTSTLQESKVDSLGYFARVTEHQLGYVDAQKQQIRFFVNHFSGYLISTGRSGLYSEVY